MQRSAAAVSVLTLFVIVAHGATIQENVNVRDVALRSAAQSRIVGGTETDISFYPYAVAMLFNEQDGVPHQQYCGGAILTSRAVLSAANCYDTTGSIHEPRWWKARVGSTFANSGGSVHDVAEFVLHPDFDYWTYNNDVAIVRLFTSVTYIPNQVQAGFIAGPNYNVADDVTVTLIGWGAQYIGGSYSEELRHVDVRAVNQELCKQLYNVIPYDITDGMLCAGILNEGGKDHCGGDVGGPLLHNGVIVGISSWAKDCGDRDYPGVNARVTYYSNWIAGNGST